MTYYEKLRPFYQTSLRCFLEIPSVFELSMWVQTDFGRRAAAALSPSFPLVECPSPHLHTDEDELLACVVFLAAERDMEKMKHEESTR